MRRLIIVTCCFVVAAIISCSRDKKTDFAAANAAKEYYDMLVLGEYNQFVKGMHIRIYDIYLSKKLLVLF